jgi:putative transcriptional regulator
MPTATHNPGAPLRPAKLVAKKGGERSRAGAKQVAKRHSVLGLQIIAGLDEIIGAVESGGMAAVEKKFTVRRLKSPAFEKPALRKADVVAIRATLGASQSVFASLLGVSPATVRAWEQGVNAPSGMALRFLAEIRANPGYWKSRLEEAAGK